jgi:5'(3')-deoxyribonucleotidase
MRPKPTRLGNSRPLFNKKPGFVFLPSDPRTSTTTPGIRPATESEDHGVRPSTLRAVLPSFVFGVDLDGVCADYTLGFRAIVATELGIDPAALPAERSWGFDEWGLDETEFARLHKKAVTEHRMFRTLPAIAGCADALWRLSDAGIWIRIITHRLYTNWGHAEAVADTVTWLDEARIPYRDICFLGAKPQVEADIYIDDAPHNVDALRAAGNEVIVFDAPYNAELPGPRAGTWSDVEELVLAAAAARGAVQPQLPGIDSGADRIVRRKDGDRSASPGRSGDQTAGW